MIKSAQCVLRSSDYRVIESPPEAEAGHFSKAFRSMLDAGLMLVYYLDRVVREIAIDQQAMYGSNPAHGESIIKGRT